MIKEGAIIAGGDMKNGLFAYRFVNGEWKWDRDMIEQMNRWIDEYDKENISQ